MPASKRKRDSLIRSVVNGPASGTHVVSLDPYPINERILTRRAELLHSRQKQMEQLMQEHEELIREAFHLEKFVRLLDYDPNLAKNDTSQVFLEYKAEHDLLDKSAAAVATPLHKTRRAKTELRSSLAATITSSSPSPLPSPFKDKTRPFQQPPLKAVAVNPVSICLVDKTSPKAIDNNVSQYSPKLKNGLHNVPSSPGPIEVKDTLSIRSPELGLSEHYESPTMSPESMAEPRETPPPLASMMGTRSLSPTPLPPAQAESPTFSGQEININASSSTLKPPSVHPTPPRPRPTEESIAKLETNTQISAPVVYTSPSRGLKRKTPSSPFTNGVAEVLKSSSKEPTSSDIGTSALPLKFRIKRVRLFQKPRPIKYTHPVQIPPRPLHGGSIRSFLSSYRSLEDGIDVTDGMLSDMSFSEAKTRARIRTLRKEGRLMMNVEDLPLESVKFSALKGDLEEVKRDEDVSDYVTAGVCSLAHSMALERVYKKNTAKKISKSVLAWHGNRETLAEKQRKAEVLRMKSLAKFIAKEVEKQWKKAVETIREKHRTLIEKEEARLGQLHLDAILDRSGMILEAQHLDLTQGRSRSRSQSISQRELSDLEGSGEDADSFNEEESLDAYNEEEVDASFLLGYDIQSFNHTPTSDTDIASVLDDDADQSVMDEEQEEPIPVVSTGTPASVEDDVADPELSSFWNDEGSIGVVNVNEALTGDDLSEASRQMSPVNNMFSSSPSSPNPTPDFREYVIRSVSPSSQPSLAPSPIDYRLGPLPSQITGQTTNDMHTSPPSEEAIDLADTSKKSVLFPQTSDGDLKEDALSSEQPRSQGMLHETESTVGIDATGSAQLELTVNKTPTEEERVQDLEQTSQWETATMEGKNIETNGSPKANPVSIPVISEKPNGISLGEDPDDQSEHEDYGDEIPPELADFAVVPVELKPDNYISSPGLLRGTLRPYQQAGLEWLVSLHANTLNGILADEMGLGKTIQTISLLGHLAYDRGVWGPHLIIVPTSVLLNWEMEFKKFLPGFKILAYHGSTKRRKELRIGWNNRHAFNVCVTSYTLASRDAHIFKRKAWYYMILDEAHMIKNFKSQRWNILLMFRSYRRLLLTGTPLQNNLTELWSLLQFLMSGTNFANLKEFGDWFANPLEKAIEQGTIMDEETQERVKKLHTVLRPYLLRRLKVDVEKELPKKYEHLVMCRLSKRQRFLYDEFMSRAETRTDLNSGVYHKVANILMQLRKVCNHPDLFEVRPIITSFVMPRSTIADYEIKELVIRRRCMQDEEGILNLGLLGLVFIQHQGKSMMQARSTRTLDASSLMVKACDILGELPPTDRRTIEGFQRLREYQRKLAALHHWTQISYINELRCGASPLYGYETISAVRRLYNPIIPFSDLKPSESNIWDRSYVVPLLVKSYAEREEQMANIIDRFAFITPPVLANGMARLALRGCEEQIAQTQSSAPHIADLLHRTCVKLQIVFPDVSLVQYDCGKLQELASLLHIRKMGNHRVLIFTQMTKVLDILEIFLNFHGYRYMRLDGTTKVEERQYRTELFNADPRYFAFIASSRSGGVGINLTGADTVIFYDSDFNPQMDRQCEDRAHRIGQIRDVHIYRFVSGHTVEEAMLRKADQKRSLDKIVIQEGEFDWRQILTEVDKGVLDKALEEFVDQEDAAAARKAAREEQVREVEDLADFAVEGDEATGDVSVREGSAAPTESEEPEEERTIADYMVSFVDFDWEWFSTWRL